MSKYSEFNAITLNDLCIFHFWSLRGHYNIQKQIGQNGQLKTEKSKRLKFGTLHGTLMTLRILMPCGNPAWLNNHSLLFCNSKFCKNTTWVGLGLYEFVALTIYIPIHPPFTNELIQCITLQYA